MTVNFVIEKKGFHFYFDIEILNKVTSFVSQEIKVSSKLKFLHPLDQLI